MKKHMSASVLAVAIASLPSPALAQDAPAEETGTTQDQVGLSDIIVTATKRSENLQDVPVAVSAISSESLQNKGVFETSDLNNTMPNFQVSSPYGQQQPNLSVRGVETRRASCREREGRSV